MELSCKYCNKKYASQSSRSNHIKKYHSPDISTKVTPKIKVTPKTLILVENQCQMCTKIFSRSDSLNRHINLGRCKSNKNELVKMKEEIIKMKEEINKLSKKPETKSIINLNNSGTINIVNNINSLGYEDIQKKLSEREKINLVTSMRVKEHPIIELVRKIYTDDKFIEDRNTLITNLRAKDCLIYNSDTNKFDATTKADHIDNIIENRKNNIVSLYNELSNNNKLRPVEIKAIDSYLEEIENLGKKNPKVKELYEKHKAEIIYIIYNCKEFMNKVRDNLPDVVENVDDENSIEV